MYATKRAAAKEEERRFMTECVEVYRSVPALRDVKINDHNYRKKNTNAYEVLLTKFRGKFP
jgi:hypothetical protein